MNAATLFSFLGKSMKFYVFYKIIKIKKILVKKSSGYYFVVIL